MRPSLVMYSCSWFIVLLYELLFGLFNFVVIVMKLNSGAAHIVGKKEMGLNLPPLKLRRVRTYMRLQRLSTSNEINQYVELWALVREVHLTDQPDDIEWRFSADGSYSSSSAYLFQFAGAFPKHMIGTGCRSPMPKTNANSLIG